VIREGRRRPQRRPPAAPRVLSDRIVVEITQEPGGFLPRPDDRSGRGAPSRRKTPNEIALGILLSALTLVFVVVVVSLRPFALFRRHRALRDDPDRIAGGADPDHDRGAALGDRQSPAWTDWCAATCSPSPARAVEALRRLRWCCLLDKTGTITLGNREATEFVPMPGVGEAELAEAAQMSSLADETPEGRSIVVPRQGLRGPRARLSPATSRASSPSRRRRGLSGVDYDGTRLRKGAPAMRSKPGSPPRGGRAPAELKRELDRIGREGRHAAGGCPATSACSGSSTSRTWSRKG